MVYAHGTAVFTIPEMITAQLGSLLSVQVAPGSTKVSHTMRSIELDPLSVTTGGVVSGSSATVNVARVGLVTAVYVLLVLSSVDARVRI